jgi:hypothetical protein
VLIGRRPYGGICKGVARFLFWEEKDKRCRKSIGATRRCGERCSGGDELLRHVVALIGVHFAGDEGCGGKV